MNPLLSMLKPPLRIFGYPLEVHDNEKQVDAIVVLGVPVRPDGELSLAGRERVDEGVRLFHQDVAPLLVFTGGAAHSAAEAPVMAAAAIRLKVPASQIIVEDESLTTAQNAFYTARKLREHGVRSVRVVSQPFHLRRGRRLFRQEGFEAQAIAWKESVQYARPDLAVRWVLREYVAWAAHFTIPWH